MIFRLITFQFKFITIKKKRAKNDKYYDYYLFFLCIRIRIKERETKHIFSLGIIE